MASARDFLTERGCASRDAVVLVPQLPHLGLARRAWMQGGGWMPRIETARTLAQSLAAPAAREPGQLSFDAASDRLSAAALLRSQNWARDWVHSDPRRFDEAVAAVVSTAQTLARAAAAVPPGERDAFWTQARSVVPLAPGPGAVERALARVALEWAAVAPAPITDALFALRPSAWVVVRAGGPDALADALLRSADDAVPCVCIDADLDVPQALSQAPEVRLATCDDIEHEAQCAAAQVLRDVEAGRVPVALVAEDRVLVRRVRALLERHDLPLLDETGWKLSTTRAGAQLMALLRAAPAHAPANALFDWLKTTPSVWPPIGDTRRSRAELETLCRRRGWRRLDAIDAEQLSEAARTLLHAALAALQPLSATRRQSVPAWMSALQQALDATGTWDALSQDEAGQQVLAALHWGQDDFWRASSGAPLTMSLEELVAWISAVLEEASFVPPAPGEEAPVVITPLARLPLRPFAAVVLPGADARHLGGAGVLHPLLSDAQVMALGLPGAQQRHEIETLHFAHAVAAPRITLLHRRVDEGEPLAESPLVERLRLLHERAGREVQAWVDARERTVLPIAPVRMPAPSAPNLLPQQMSASACEALRACPYRFHALHVLGLREPDELDGEAAKRDYGTWLHEVLHTFHAQRDLPAEAAVEVARLQHLARELQATHGLDDADFLPFVASFEQLAPRYIAWLHARDAEGAQWWQGEQDRRITPPDLGGLALYGRIDRADRVRGEDGVVVELIDYKTGSADALKRQVKQPLEDTQLAFYAALMRDATDAPLAATYLALDGSKGIEAIAHPEVERSAEALLAGLAHDMARLREGAGMPALGEGRVCEFCEARGLCRKDHWQAEEGTLP